MTLSIIYILLILAFLTSCGSKPSGISESQPSPINSPSPSASPLSIPSENLSSVADLAKLNRIDPILVQPGDQFNIQLEQEIINTCIVAGYPQVSGLEDQAVQSRLNRSLRRELLRQLRVVTRELNCFSAAPHSASFFTRVNPCRVQFAEDRLVSLSCVSLTTPGAYPNVEILTATFDLKTGRIYQLADLFKPGSNYVVRLAIAMRDEWWEIRGHFFFPFEQLETGANFNYYLQTRCKWEMRSRTENTHLKEENPSPNVCIVIPDLGSGASRNYLMFIRLANLANILNTSDALNVLAKGLDLEQRPY